MSQSVPINPYYIIVICQRFNIMFINEAAAQLLGASSQQGTSNLFELFASNHYINPVDKDFFNRGATTQESRHQDIIWQIYPFSLSNSAQYALLIGQKKQLLHEQNIAHNLKQFMDSTPGSFYWKDSQGVYLGCNQFMVEAAELKSIDDIIGKTDQELWPASADRIRENDLEVMQHNKTTSIEEKVTLQSGESMYFTSVKKPLKNDQNEIIGVIGNSLDISQLKQTEKALQKAKEHAEASNRSKSEFIRNMEHDIRTPLNGMLGFAEILVEQEADIEKKDYLSCVARCAEELLEYCNSVLEFSRVEQGSTPIIDKAFALRKLVNTVKTIESIAARHKQLQLIINIDDDCPDVVIGDPYRVKCILLNLIGNAIKFTESGHVKLSIQHQIKQNMQRQCILKLIVEDTGIGIADEKKQLIYERFTRGTPSNQGIYRGQGLGLNVVKQFVSELDGDIHLSSEPGKGSTFTVLLAFKLPLTDDILDEH